MRRSSLLLKSNTTSAATGSNGNDNGRRISITGSTATNDENEGDMDKDPRTAMQKKTFRRWCNSYLDERSMVVNHIINDWHDGTYLINLLEVLSEGSLPKYNKTPKLKAHKIENLNNAIKFITNVAKVHLVNIGSEDIFKGNQTIILGLIWTLILRFGLKLKDGKSGLLNWAISKSKDSGIEIKNFTTSWQDGMAFCALIHSHRPDLLDIKECSPSQPLENMEKAFTAAEIGLDVGRLLDPNDVLATPDEKSIVAYVGELHKAFSNKPKESDNKQQPLPPKLQASVSSTPKSENKEEAAAAVTASSTVSSTASSTASASSPAPEPASAPAPVEETHVLIPVEEKKEEEKPELLHTPDPPRIVDPEISTVQIQWNVVPHATKTKVQVILADGSWDKPLKSEDHSVSSSSCIMKGLAPGKDYKARVIAVKSGLLSSKESEPSEESLFSTRAIGAPTAPFITGSTLSTVDLEWENPENSVGAVIQYCHDPHDWENSTSVTLGQGITRHTFENLYPGTKYEFRMISNTDDGSSPPSVSVPHVTPFPPMNKPSTDNVSETTAQLSWEPFPNATSYQVEILTVQKEDGKDPTIAPEDEYWQYARKAVTTGSPVVVDELQPGTTNHFRVIAITPNGTSLPSESIYVSMATAAMQSPIIEMAGDNGLQISWDPYLNATKYKIEIREPNNEDWKDARVEEVDASLTKIKVYEIEPDTNYEVRIVPVTNDSEAEPSFAVPITTPSTTKVFGKIALVTGANSKRGCEQVRSLAKEGSGFWSWSSGFSRIFVCAYKPSPELKEIASKYDQVTILEMDTSNPESVREAARQLHNQAPYIDVFINNAGFAPETIALLMTRPN